MDEPLSNLDAKLRVQMRAEIAKLQHDLGTTTIYVTHDQVEAMTMGDRVAVMNMGVLQQIDRPAPLRRAREPLRRQLHRDAADEHPRRGRGRVGGQGHGLRSVSQAAPGCPTCARAGTAALKAITGSAVVVGFRSRGPPPGRAAPRAADAHAPVELSRRSARPAMVFFRIDARSPERRRDARRRGRGGSSARRGSPRPAEPRRLLPAAARAAPREERRGRRRPRRTLHFFDEETGAALR